MLFEKLAKPNLFSSIEINLLRRSNIGLKNDQELKIENILQAQYQKITGKEITNFFCLVLG